MASQGRNQQTNTHPSQQSHPTESQPSNRPTDALMNIHSNLDSRASLQSNQSGAKKKKRGGKKKKNRRQSFLPAAEEESVASGQLNRPAEAPTTAVAGTQQPFYRLAHTGVGNLSETSLDSEALLDHRYVWQTTSRVAEA